MNEFTATNGLTVRHEGPGVVILDVDGRRNRISGYDFLNRADMAALREFFQHERDAELGRWRWPENPDYVVYPQHPEGGGRPDSFRVFQESTGYTWSYDLEHLGDTEGVPWDAARAYFNAHPERKPWHDAEPGEVWALDYGHGERAAIVLEANTDATGRLFSTGPTMLSPLNPTIVSARRIWPEGDDS